MKKQLLFIFIITAIILFARSTVCFTQNKTRNIIIHTLANKAYPFQKNLYIHNDISCFPSSIPNLTYAKKTPLPLAGLMVGITCFDMGSYNAMGRSIINHADGTRSFVFTADDDCSSNYAKRGSGYNYWNGTALLYPAGSSQRIESTRTGFSQIAFLGSGTEVIMAHNTPPYDFKRSTNGAKGAGTWTGINVSATLDAGSVPGYTAGTTTEQAPWARIASGGTDGNTIHLLANYYQGATNPPPGPVIKGILAPFVYSRSTDGGITWDLKSVMLPGYDSTRSLQGDPETYAIDADLNTVAILHGGLGEDLTLWKSTDNGTTWTRTLVDSFPYAPDPDLNGTNGDTVITNDGGMSVVLAPNGTTHVAFSTERLLDDTPGDGSFSIFPGDIGLVYWNDNTKQQVIIPITEADIDAASNGGNNSGILEVGQYTTNYNGSNGPAARYGNRAFLSIPSISVDGNNIFIVFSLITDADTTQDGQSFRDVWVVVSQDGGATWGKIQNVTCTKEEEEYHVSLAKRVDSNLHILYQSDIEPGSSVQNGDPVVASEVRYAMIDKAKALAGTTNCSSGNPGVNEQQTHFFSVASSYPNPSRGLTYFDITVKKNAVISLEVFNHLGQQVYVLTGELSLGKHTLSLDARAFASGLYFYTIKSGDAIVSGKITVVE